jgi:tetratricopeptide (TPR) repeat protein
MTIRDRTGQTQTITEGSRALDLFTDRKEAAHRFASYLNDEPPKESVLFFYGDGGNGKSLLLRFLRESCCKRLRPEDWDRIKNLPEDEFLPELQSTSQVGSLPVAALDFVHLDDRRPFEALLKLHRNLASTHSMRFPVFDFACVWYLKQTKRLDKEQLKDLFPSEEMDFVFEIADACLSSFKGSLVKAVLALFNKHLATGIREDFTLWMHKRKLTEKQLDEIQNWDPEVDLVRHLPEFFAADLNAAFSPGVPPKRIVLFFDTHEAFWGQECDLSDALFFERDEWLRRLLLDLEFAKGIVVVAAGRDVPRWPEAREFAIPSEFLDLQMVWHLSERHALQYLDLAGVRDSALQQSIVAYAAVATDQVNPLLLGLSADVALAAEEHGKAISPAEFPRTPETISKQQMLVDRLLRYVNQDTAHAVRAVSACRAFDREIYFRLGAALRFNATDASFAALTRFSFVRPLTMQHGDGWYRIQDILRRVFAEREDEDTHRADGVMEAYFREQSENNDSAAAEAVYHAFRVDAVRGFEEWRAKFEAGSRAGRYGLCRSLLSVVTEMRFDKYARGLVDILVSDYFTDLAQYDQALSLREQAVQDFDEVSRRAGTNEDGVTRRQEESAKGQATICVRPVGVDVQIDKGRALMKVGELAIRLGRHSRALAASEEASKVCDKVLVGLPDNADALALKGSALRGRAEVQTILHHYADASTSLQEAITICDHTLQGAPNDDSVLHAKGLALLTLARLRQSLKEYGDAVESFQRASDTFEQALQVKGPAAAFALNDKAAALLGRGDAQMALNEPDKALESFRQGIAVYDQLLDLAPGDVVALTNKAMALGLVGDLSNGEEALRNYQQALQIHDQVLSIAPDQIESLTGKAATLRCVAWFHHCTNQPGKELASLQDAAEILSQVLERAPDLQEPLARFASTLQNIASLQTTLGQPEKALDSYQRAVQTYDKLYGLLPDDAKWLSRKGETLLSVASLQHELKQPEEELKSLEACVAVLDGLLRCTPDDDGAFRNKANATVGIARLEARLQRPDKALEAFNEALSSIEEVLRRAPEDSDMLSLKGGVLADLGDLKDTLEQHEAAIDSYRGAIATCDLLLKLTTVGGETLNWKGVVIGKLAHLQLRLERYEMAEASFREAVTTFDEALQRTPGKMGFHANRGKALARLGQVQLAFSSLRQRKALESFEAALSEISACQDDDPNDKDIIKWKTALEDHIRVLKRCDTGMATSSTATE